MFRVILKITKGCKTRDCTTTATEFPEKLKLNKNNIKQIGDIVIVLCQQNMLYFVINICFIENLMPGASGICIHKTTKTTKKNL